MNAITAEVTPAVSRVTPWSLLILVASALPGSPVAWPKDAPDIKFPSKIITAHQDYLKGRRLLTEDRWAGYLIYRSYPAQKVFFDGRSDFYGEAMTREYLAAVNGRHNWRDVLDKYRIDAVMVPPRFGLASLLKDDPGWRVLADDKLSVLFERIAVQPTLAASVRQKADPDTNEITLDRRR